jgi:hypothetical protein
MSDTSSEAPHFLKVKDVPNGTVLTLENGRTQQGKYGEQVVARTSDGNLVSLSMNSGIAKGLLSGKLHFPLRITPSTVFGSKGPYRTFTLAPRTL